MSIIKSYNIFNEELRSTTYKSASDKLKKMGHVKRSKDISDYSNIVRDREKAEKIKDTYQDLSRFPSFRLSLVEGVNDSNSLIGNFFIKVWLNQDWFSNTIEDWQKEKIKNGTPSWDIYAPFSVGILPVDDDMATTMRTDEYFDYCRGDDGVY